MSTRPQADDEPLELRLARAAYAAAEEIKKAAEQDRAVAEYDRGQADWRLREIQALEKIISAREKKLEELGEATLLAREKAADAKLGEAQTLLAQYHADRHGAMISLQRIDAREKAERGEAA
jgi:hypothetical protein